MARIWLGMLFGSMAAPVAMAQDVGAVGADNACAPPGRPTTAITSCGTVITESGTYVVDADLSCAGASTGFSPVTGIAIFQAQDVRLCLQGHTIDAGAGVAIGIIGSGATNVDIRGPGRVVDGGGVIFQRGNGNSVADLEIDCAPAVQFVAIFLDTADENAVSGVQVESCSAGFRMLDSLDNRFEHNTTASAAVGIHAISSDGNVFIGNQLIGGEFGIQLSSSRENVFIANTARENSILDISDTNPCDNSWRHDFFDTDSEGDGPRAGCIR